MEANIQHGDPGKPRNCLFYVPFILMKNFRHDSWCRKSHSELKPPQNAALWFIHVKVSKLQLIFKKTQNN